ncbi:1-acyl-sn-glycerol-3-phosphate acyltransferase [Arthrobacter roseus]|uniref:1-acyl-sn-glycerol-3-phosphate acyltransferase n=1 Tax=Arthrobacter roseus TaxID=136274 RepID=UPI0019647CFB|nr:1-acyl-sn-glycerol-3-phosphate acyltransferase [Arthrobacter roseus]
MTWKPSPNDRVYRAVVYSGVLFLKVFRMKVIISGRENLPAREAMNGPSRKPAPGNGAVIAITHFGYLDFVFAEWMLWKELRAQMRFLVTKRAAAHWFTGPIVHATGHVIVDRSAGADGYRGALEKLRQGEYVAVLPEAGVSRSYRVRELKTGATRLAAEAGVPIIPVSIWGAHRMLSRGHGFSARRAWRAPVRVHIGKPIRHDQQVADMDVVGETNLLRAELQNGIDRGIADFPLQPEPGAWWMPAHLGGGAMTEEERIKADDVDRAEGRHRRG